MRGFWFIVVAMKHLRRIAPLLSLAVLLCGSACSTTQTTGEPLPANNRYNVVLICIDDLRPELGCYGVDYVETPNIDRLAAEGILFRNHFVCVPTCGASRYAMLTGRSPEASGVRRGNNAFYQGNSALSQEQVPGAGAESMPELFCRSGYHTVLMGKVSHTADGRVFAYDGSGDGRDELPNAWDELATPLGDWGRGWGVFFAYEGGAHREDGQGHRDLMQFTAENDDDLPDGLMASAAVEKLAQLRDRDEPFFLGLGFFKPHMPFVATRGDWEAVQDWDVPPPAHPQRADTAHWHNSGEFYGYNVPWEKTRPLATEDAMQARRAYLACVRYTDRQVGRVLDALDELGLADNTVVVLWSDHGWFLGEGALWGKHAPLEYALNSPLIIRAPSEDDAEYFSQGLATDALASTLDLYPTLVDLCQSGLTQTRYPLDGVSLGPVLRGEASGVRDQVKSYWGNAVTIRSADYRLVMRGNGEEAELYDITHPQRVFENLASQRPDLVSQMRETAE